MNELHAFLDSPAGWAVKGAMVAAFLDFAVGLFAALRDDKLALDAIAAFLRKHMLGRVLPSTLIVVAAYATADASLMGAAIVALTAYATETMASIYRSLRYPARIPVD